MCDREVEEAAKRIGAVVTGLLGADRYRPPARSQDGDQGWSSARPHLILPGSIHTRRCFSWVVTRPPSAALSLIRGGVSLKKESIDSANRRESRGPGAGSV